MRALSRGTVRCLAGKLAEIELILAREQVHGAESRGVHLPPFDGIQAVPACTYRVSHLAHGSALLLAAFGQERAEALAERPFGVALLVASHSVDCNQHRRQCKLVPATFAALGPTLTQVTATGLGCARRLAPMPWPKYAPRTRGRSGADLTQIGPVAQTRSARGWRNDVPVPVAKIYREYDFDAAHQLEWHPGACQRLHGHTYTLEVSVAGNLDERGVVMDFAELDQVVRTRVLDLVDHQYLNDVIENPTAERIAQWMWDRLVDGGIVPADLRLWETRRSSVHLSHPSQPGLQVGANG